MIDLHLKKSNHFVPKEFRSISRLRIVYILAFAVAFFVLVGTSYFVYNNVYVTIGSVDSILILRQNPQVEPIDFGRLERVKDAWDTKHNQTKIILSRDPFQSTPAVSSTSASDVVSQTNLER